MAWTTPRDWTTGEVVTEAMMDTHVRDNLSYLKGEVDARRHENFLINGGMDFFQRQVPGTLTAFSDDTYGPDRWNVLTQTASIQVQRSAGNRAPNDCLLKQNQVAAQRMGIEQIIEGAQSIPLRSKTVQLSFAVKASVGLNLRYAILEWTGTKDTVTSDVVNDWTSAIYTAGNFFLGANLTVTAVGMTAATTGWTTMTLSATLGASVNNVIVLIWTEGTAAQNVTVELSELVLSEGTAYWNPRNPAEELHLCQRYFEKSYSLDVAPQTNGDSAGIILGKVGDNTIENNEEYGTVQYLVAKRALPSITIYPYTTASNTGRVSDAAGTDLAASSGTIPYSNVRSFVVRNGSGGTLVAVRKGVIFHFAADAEL